MARLRKVFLRMLNEEEPMQKRQRKKNRYTNSTQKGGPGKTTTTLNHSIAATLSGKRVLVIDWDHGQGNLTYALGYTPWVLERSGYTAMLGDSDPTSTILPTYYDPGSGVFFDPTDEQKMRRLGLSSLAQAVRGPDLLPMNPNHCEGTEQSLVVKRGDWGLLLDNLIATLEDEYDEFHIDTNPDIQSVYPKIAANASSHIVIPSQPENWAVQGWIMYARFLMAARTMNPTLAVAGVLFTHLRYAAHKEILQAAESDIIPAVNDTIQQVRDSYQKAGKLSQAALLDGLALTCFECTTTESKVYSFQTNRRATVMTAPMKTKTEFVPALEYWQSYTELLRRCGGEGVEAAIDQYNLLLERYERARDN
jgi:cellulose biosynthesis protein BcsQ